MSNRQRIFFILLALTYLGVDTFSEGTHPSLYLLKPSLVSTLALFFWKQYKGTQLVKYGTLAALVLSVAGDTTLMFSGNTAFLIGLSFFLMSHVMYIFTFVKLNAFKNGFNWLSLFLHAFLVFSALNYLWDDLGSYQIPVLIYTTVIVAVRFTIRHLPLQQASGVHLMLGYGSLLFILSDFLIALGKFKAHDIEVAYHHLLVMITYILAQYLLVEGLLKTND